MAYAFDPTESDVQASVRRIACEQLASALATVSDAGSGAGGKDGADLATQVHSLRKAVKKLRGLIRLVRPVFRDFAAENAALRAVGRQIAALRESAVLGATAADIAAGLPEADGAALLAALSGIPADTEATTAALGPFAAALGQIAARAPGWRIRGAGFAALEPGLKRSWTEARAAMTHALRDPAPEHLHDWRKRAKDHWYQARLLQQIWPAGMAAHLVAADALGETLGQSNDLAVFEDRMARLTTSDPHARRAADLAVKLAAERRIALVAEATHQGQRLFADRPGALTRRWRAWWQVAAEADVGSGASARNEPDRD